MNNLALLLVFVGLFCGFLGLAGWIGDALNDALALEHREEQDRLQ